MNERRQKLVLDSSDLKDFDRYVEEAKQLLGFDINPLISVIGDYDHCHIIISKQGYKLLITTTIGDTHIEFCNPKGSRIFKVRT